MLKTRAHDESRFMSLAGGRRLRFFGEKQSLYAGEQSGRNDWDRLEE